MPISGGARYRRVLRDAAHGKTRTLRVGIPHTASYPNGTPVAVVAAAHEFGVRNRDGTVRLPELAYMRRAVAGLGDEIRAAARSVRDPETLEMDRNAAEALGDAAVGAIQHEIDVIDLIDTGRLRSSFSYETD